MYLYIYTNKNYRGKKNYYVNINFCNPITQCKKSIIRVDTKKRHTLKTTYVGHKQ